MRAKQKRFWLLSGGLMVLFLLQAAQRVPPHHLAERRRNLKRRRRNGITPPFIISFIFTYILQTVTVNLKISFSETCQRRRKTGRCSSDSCT